MAACIILGIFSSYLAFSLYLLWARHLLNQDIDPGRFTRTGSQPWMDIRLDRSNAGWFPEFTGLDPTPDRKFPALVDVSIKNLSDDSIAVSTFPLRSDKNKARTSVAGHDELTIYQGPPRDLVRRASEPHLTSDGHEAHAVRLTLRFEQAASDQLAHGLRLQAILRDGP